MSTGDVMNHLAYYSDTDEDSISGTITAPTIIKKKATSRMFRCGKKFKAQIQTNGVQHYLGLYDTEDEAALAYDKHSRLILGPKAKTNFDTSLELADDAAHLRNAVLDIEPVKQRGAHPRRTYIGIKQKRKRMAEVSVELGSVNLQNLQKTIQDSDSNVLPMRTRDAEWRNQSFFWFGALAYDPVAFVFSWKGSLLGYSKNRPTAEQLQWSRNYFDYSGPSSVQPEIVLSGATLRPLSGKFKGSYMLDDGNGSQEKYSDFFDLDFREIPGSIPMQYTVVGVGFSDVGGKFVLDGAYDSSSRALALSRNYVRLSDPLGMLTFSDLKSYHGRQLTSVDTRAELQASQARSSVVAASASGQPPQQLHHQLGHDHPVQQQQQQSVAENADIIEAEEEALV